MHKSRYPSSQSRRTTKVSTKYQKTILQPPPLGPEHITLISSGTSQHQLTTTKTAFFQRLFAFGIPSRPPWPRLPVWYLSNRSSGVYHLYLLNKICLNYTEALQSNDLILYRAGQCKYVLVISLCYAGGHFVGPGTS